MSPPFIGLVGFNLGDHLSALLISFLDLIMDLSLDLLCIFFFFLCSITTKVHNAAFTDKLAFQNKLQDLHDRIRILSTFKRQFWHLCKEKGREELQ